MDVAGAEARGRPMALAFVRPPVQGRVKSRLAATEGAAEALRIYRLLAQDVSATLLEAQRQGLLDLVLCVDDASEGDATLRALADWLPGARAAWPQGPGDLGARMERAAARAFAAGAPAVLLVGTDIVGLTVERLREACAALAHAEVVLAATPDGGYALLGLGRPAPTLFQDIPWSTPEVAARTRARAAVAGLTLRELVGLRDVDTAADLAGVLPTLSVLVPVLDEMPRLPERLGALLQEARGREDEVEILVADGGSRDGSAQAARALGLRVLDAPPGRGTQLRAAAAAARGRWLWTLHADARVEPGTLARVLDHARRGTHPWAFVRTRIDLPGPYYRLLGTLTEIRARWLRLPYGDQGVLVRRSLYEHVGGYADVPLMEDVLLAQRLKRYARPAQLGGCLTLDGRRWRRYGPLATTAGNLTLLARLLLGHARPQDLVRGYDRALG